MSTNDPTQLVNDLDPEAIARQLDDLERTESALRVLLRAARARQRQGQPRCTKEKVKAQKC